MKEIKNTDQYEEIRMRVQAYKATLESYQWPQMFTLDLTPTSEKERENLYFFDDSKRVGRTSRLTSPVALFLLQTLVSRIKQPSRSEPTSDVSVPVNAAVTLKELTRLPDYPGQPLDTMSSNDITKLCDRLNRYLSLLAFFDKDQKFHEQAIKIFPELEGWCLVQIDKPSGPHRKGKEDYAHWKFSLNPKWVSGFTVMGGGKETTFDGFIQKGGAEMVLPMKWMLWEQDIVGKLDAFFVEDAIREIDRLNYEYENESEMLWDAFLARLQLLKVLALFRGGLLMGDALTMVDDAFNSLNQAAENHSELKRHWAWDHVTYLRLLYNKDLNGLKKFYTTKNDERLEVTKGSSSASVGWLNLVLAEVGLKIGMPLKELTTLLDEACRVFLNEHNLPAAQQSQFMRVRVLLEHREYEEGLVYAERLWRQKNPELRPLTTPVLAVMLYKLISNTGRLGDQRWNTIARECSESLKNGASAWGKMHGLAMHLALGSQANINPTQRRYIESEIHQLVDMYTEQKGPHGGRSGEGGRYAEICMQLCAIHPPLEGVLGKQRGHQ